MTEISQAYLDERKRLVECMRIRHQAKPWNLDCDPTASSPWDDFCELNLDAMAYVQEFSQETDIEFSENQASFAVCQLITDVTGRQFRGAFGTTEIRTPA